jgi:hypothetical protein
MVAQAFEASYLVTPRRNHCLSSTPASYLRPYPVAGDGHKRSEKEETLSSKGGGKIQLIV